MVSPSAARADSTVAATAIPRARRTTRPRPVTVPFCDSVLRSIDPNVCMLIPPLGFGRGWRDSAHRRPRVRGDVIRRRYVRGGAAGGGFHDRIARQRPRRGRQVAAARKGRGVRRGRALAAVARPGYGGEP